MLPSGAHTFGGAGDDEAIAIIPIADGAKQVAGYFIAGTTESMGAGLGDFYLLRVSTSGTEEASYTFGTEEDEECLAACGTSDGGVVMAGVREADGHSEFYAVSVAADGTERWTSSLAGAGLNELNGVVEASNGDLVFCGYAGQMAGSFETQFYMRRVATDGTLVWANTYGDYFSSSLAGVTALPDGGFLGAGATVEQDDCKRGMLEVLWHGSQRHNG